MTKKRLKSFGNMNPQDARAASAKGGSYTGKKGLASMSEEKKAEIIAKGLETRMRNAQLRREASESKLESVETELAS